MVCKTTFTKRSAGGFTLIETVIATGIGAIVLMALMSLAFYSGRSLAAIANYVDLDNSSRNALDIMTRDIRESHSLITYASNQLVFDYTNGVTLTFYYDPNARTLTRTLNGVSKVLLTECDYLNFSIYQRNPVGGTYDEYPTASPATCKLVQLTWICSRTILGEAVNTESVQSAKVVLRNE